MQDGRSSGLDAIWLAFVFRCNLVGKMLCQIATYFLSRNKSLTMKFSAFNSQFQKKCFRHLGYSSKKRWAKLYRNSNPKEQQNTWNPSNIRQRDCSVIGPKIWRNTFINVILTISPPFSLLNVDGSIKPVRGLNLGRRCLGQGTNLNSWGIDQTKFMTWGIKNNKSVLLKWPRIPTTANVMPAK